jgi:hypothetical protein
MLMVVVVHKYGDMQPGPGFLELANAFPATRKTTSKFWIAELRNVHAISAR